MTHSHRRGFTLIELMVVIGVLALLAAVVVPQLAQASDLAVKTELRTKLELVNGQIEAFRIDHAGRLPHELPETGFLDAASNDGWGALVNGVYLRFVPANRYVGLSTVIEGNQVNALGSPEDAEAGWYYEASPLSNETGRVFAAGYRDDNDTLAHEPGFLEATPIEYAEHTDELDH